MAAVFVVVISLARALAFARALNSAHDHLTGRNTGEQRSAWLRSMNTQGQDYRRSDVAMSTPERIVATSVCVAVIALVGRFFLFAGSPLPGEDARSPCLRPIRTGHTG